MNRHGVNPRGLNPMKPVKTGFVWQRRISIRPCNPPMRDGSTGMDAHGVNPRGVNPHGMNPHGINPHGVNPHGMNPHGINPAAGRQNRLKPVGDGMDSVKPVLTGFVWQWRISIRPCNPPTRDGSTGMDAHGVNPRGINPRGINPRGVNPHGMNPHGVNPHGINPRGINPHGINPAAGRQNRLKPVGDGTNPVKPVLTGFVWQRRISIRPCNPPTRDGSTGVDAHGVNPHGINPRGINSRGVNPHGINPAAGRQNRLKPVGDGMDSMKPVLTGFVWQRRISIRPCNPPTRDGSTGVDAHGVNPRGINPRGINPRGINPRGINPCGINPRGINPAAGRQNRLKPVGDGMVSMKPVLTGFVWQRRISIRSVMVADN